MQRKSSDSVRVIWPMPFEEVMKILKLFVRELRKTKSVKDVWLFGSYASGKYSARSDVDLCIIIADDSSLTYSDVSKIYYKITSEIEGQFHIYTDTEFKRMIAENNSFVKQIVKGINLIDLIDNE